MSKESKDKLWGGRFTQPTDKFVALSELQDLIEEFSGMSVKDRIREIIAAEDPRRPYSDQHIAKMLSTEHIGIARRTVAKYRSIEGILAARFR